jgi:gliding motility-associated-like protein
MKKPLLLILTILCISSINNSFAQTQNTTGTDFWLTFMDNIDTTPGPQTLSIFANSINPCTLNITNPNTGWSSSMTINPTGTNRLYIPTSQAFNTNSGRIQNTGLHVTSTDTISLFAIIQGYPNLDYTNIIPTSMLRSNYIIQTYPSAHYYSEFVIVAAEDNVTVTIQQHGNSIDGHHDGQTYNVTIAHAGQAYQVQSTTPGDLSGTIVTAQNGKKIAVFNGDACIYIPNTNIRPSCDHVVEQAVPTEYWGTKFIVPSSDISFSDYVRITALNDNCVISVNGNNITTINQTETYEYVMSNNIDYIETSEPAMVYIYFPSTNGAGNGDPSMTTIPPIEQSIKGINFPIINTSNISSHSANIICPTSATSHIRIDGNYATFTPLPNAPNYAHLRQPLIPGPHSIYSTDTSGFIACIYGYGPRVSYGYTLGYSNRIITPIIPEVQLTINNFPSTDFPNGMNLCEGNSSTFQINCDGTIDSVRWSVSDGFSQTTNPFIYTFNTIGDYTLCAIVNYRANETDQTSFTDTLCTTVHIHPNYTTTVYDTCVQNQTPIHFGDSSFFNDVDGVQFHFISTKGCDSTIYYHLKVWPNSETHYDTTICDTLLPFLWNGFIFSYDSSITQLNTDVHGADSSIVYSLSTYHCPRTPVLPPEPHFDTVNIWAPNIFTPNQNSNQVFRIFHTNNILEADVVIYHRMGVFLTRFDGLTQFWDGTHNGKDCPSGTYVYKIRYKTTSSPKETLYLFGSVTLIR